MPYCPECKYEYVEGAEKCVDCGAKLVDRLEHEEDYSEVKIKWKRLHGQPGIVYTEMVKEVLEKRGIPCLIHRGSLLAYGVSGSQQLGSESFLLVPEDRHEECTRIITEMLDHI